MVKLREIFEDLSKENAIRKISKTYSISRQTIRKYKQVYDDVLDECDGDVDRALLEIMRMEFSYKSCQRPRSALTKEVTDKIDGMLAENEELRHTSGMRKLAKNRKNIHNSLKHDGFKVSYSSVCSYIQAKKESEKTPECFIRLRHLPGEEIEFDWGEFSLCISGVLIKVQMAVFTLCHSNFRVAYIYPSQNTLSFNDAHVKFFREIGGIPLNMIYDNMRLAVKSFSGHVKDLTDNIKSLSEHYGFNVRLCNIRSGNEKGQVERSVDVVRQFAFANRYRFDSFKEAEEYLRSRLEILNVTEMSPATEGIVERTKADLEAMRSRNPYKDDMACFEVETYKVDKYSTITFMGSHYSVPDSLVGKTVDVKIFANEIEVKHDGALQVRWSKATKRNSWQMQLDHYLNTLVRKPGAVHQSEALYQAPEMIRKIFETHFSDSPKQFVELLIYARDHGIDYGRLSEVYADIASSEIQIPKYEHYIAYLNPVQESLLNGDCNACDTAGNTLEELTSLMNGGQDDGQARA